MSRTNWPKTLLLAIATIPFLYPFAFLIATALKPVGEFQESAVAASQGADTLPTSPPPGERPGCGAAMLHSMIAVGISVVVTLIISAAGAFWFLTHRGRISKATRAVVIGTMALPASVFVIPLFIQLTELEIDRQPVVLGLVYAAWNAGFGTYLMYAYFDGLPTRDHRGRACRRGIGAPTALPAAVAAEPPRACDPGGAVVPLVLERPTDLDRTRPGSRPTDGHDSRFEPR